MTLRKTLLEKLSDWHPAGPGRHVLSSADSGWVATITADRADTMGCLLWELTLSRTGPAPASCTLRTWAEQAAQRVTGLLEPLKLIEVDELRNEALLRSAQPTDRGIQLFYCEVLLQGTHSATLRRYQASHEPGSHRQQHGYAVTHEMLAKVADDLTAVA